MAPEFGSRLREKRMEALLRRADEVAAGRPLAFDRGSGKLTGAGALDRIAVLALQAGSLLTQPYGHPGSGIGCRVVGSLWHDGRLSCD